MQSKERIPRELKVRLWLKYATYANQIRTWTSCFCCKAAVKIPEEVRAALQHDPTLLNYLGNLRSAAYGHVVPESRGGEMSEANLRIVCNECNTKMATQVLYDYCEQQKWAIVEDYKDLMDIDPETNICTPEVMNVSGREAYCCGTTKIGEPCRNKRPNNNDFCIVHTGKTILAK